jgi:hypothetical protein
MFRQRYDRLQRERASHPRITNRLSKKIDSFGEQIGRTVGQIDGEKETAAGNEMAR